MHIILTCRIQIRCLFLPAESKKNADNQTKNSGLSGVSGAGRRKLMSDLDPAGKKLTKFCSIPKIHAIPKSNLIILKNR